MNVVLSCYPLSTESMRALGDHVVPDRALALSSLRELPLRRLFGELRAIRSSRFLVVLSTTTERVLLPILLLLASLTRSRSIATIDLASGAVQPVPRWRAFTGIFASIRASLSGRLARWRCATASRRLMRAEPLQFGALAGMRGLYLKSNLMLGTHAGGSVGHIAGVANEMFRRSPETVILGLDRPAMVNPAMRFEPIAPITHYGIPRESNNLRFNRHCVSAGNRIIGRRRVDYIYQRLTVGNMAGVDLSRRHRIPLIFEYNGSEVWVAENWGLKLVWAELCKRMEDVCLRHAHRIVVVSDALVDELLERGIRRERIVCYPNCIDPELFDPDRHAADRAALRARLGLAETDIACTFLGTFGAWHGADVLAEAINTYLARPSPKGAPRLRFLMIGDGLHAPACRETLAEATARGDVIFTGLVPQAEAPAYLAGSDIFLSPHVRPTDGSRFFGSPTKLFEYMAMGRPIIASALEQISEVLSPGADVRTALELDAPVPGTLAILTEPGSADDIVAALAVLRDRPAWRVALGVAARQKALTTYTWRQHVDHIFASVEGAR